MNKIYIKSALVALMGMSLNSCSDFLEPKSSSEFVPKDANSLNELLLGEAYPRTTGTYFLEGFTHLFDDDVAMADYQEPHTGFNTEIYFIPFTWQPDLWNRLDQVTQKPSPSRKRAVSSTAACSTAVVMIWFPRRRMALA